MKKTSKGLSKLYISLEKAKGRVIWNIEVVRRLNVRH